VHFRIDAVAARVNTAVKMNSITKSMGGSPHLFYPPMILNRLICCLHGCRVVKSMAGAMKSMNPAKIQATMDKFEKQFEDLDVTSKVMESSMSESTTQSMPEDQVNALMSKVADAHGLEFEGKMVDVGGQAVNKPATVSKKDEDDLEERLRKLQEL